MSDVNPVEQTFEHAARQTNANLGESRSPSNEPPCGLRSPTIISMQSAGWLLLLCMWLPINRGCGGTINKPIEQLDFSSPYNFLDLLGDLWILGSYGNGLLAASLLAASALWRSEQLWWSSTLLQLLAAVSLSTAAIVLMFVNESEPKQVVTNVLLYLVPWLLSLTWIATALRNGQRQSAWARLQHTWTLVGAFGLQLQCIFSTEILYGYWLSLIAFAALILAVEFARHRMVHDLWERNQPAFTPRFSLRKIFLWTTFSAAVIIYCQSIQPVLDWLFPEPVH